MIRLPREIEEALAALSAPWELRQGQRHIKVLVNGQIAGILPRSGGYGGDRRAILNVASQIRRVGRTGQPARRG